MPHGVWIVVANGTRARVVQRLRPGEPLTEVKDWVNPEARRHLQDFENTDRSSGIRGRAGLAEPTPLKLHERDSFARAICQWLLEAVNTQQVAHIALLASNPFLGELNGHAQGRLQQHVCATHAVDLTALSLPELQKRLQADYRL